MQRTYTLEADFALGEFSGRIFENETARKFTVRVSFNVSADHQPENVTFSILHEDQWQDPGDVLCDLINDAFVELDEWLMDAAREQALDEDPAADERRRREGEAGRAAMQAQEARRG